jgi:ligand-binding sensor domain-containing protein
MLFGSRLYNLPDGNVMQLNSNGLLFFDRVKNNISDPQTLFPGLKKLLSIWREEKTIFFFISSTRVLVFNFKNNSFDIIDITTGKVTSLKASFDLHKEIGWQTRLTFLYNNQWALSSKRQGFFIATIDTVNNNVNCLPSKYLPNHMCNTVFADKQNRLWIGAEDGLYIQKS